MKTLLIATLLLTATPALANDEFDGRQRDIIPATYETGGPRTAGEKAGMIAMQAGGSTAISFLCAGGGPVLWGVCSLAMLGASMASQEDDPNPPPPFTRHFPPEGNE